MNSLGFSACTAASSVLCATRGMIRTPVARHQRRMLRVREELVDERNIVTVDVLGLGALDKQRWPVEGALLRGVWEGPNLAQRVREDVERESEAVRVVG